MIFNLRITVLSWNLFALQQGRNAGTQSTTYVDFLTTKVKEFPAKYLPCNYF